MFDLVSIITATGYLGVTFMIFAESGLLIGLFFPGDGLLFTAGFLASRGIMNIWLLCAFTTLAAIAGVSSGYWFGHKFGPKVFTKTGSIWLSHEHLERAKVFFAKHGAKSIVLARFVPIVRTIVPIMAGMGAMSYGLFITYNIIGAILWAFLIPFIGYYLGQVVPNIDHFILPLVLLIILASILPGIWHLIKEPATRKQMWLTARSLVKK